MTQSDSYVINPNTGRVIRTGGKAYKKLLRDGVMKENLPELDPAKAKELLAKRPAQAPAGPRPTKKQRVAAAILAARENSSEQKAPQKENGAALKLPSVNVGEAVGQPMSDEEPVVEKKALKPKTPRKLASKKQVKFLENPVENAKNESNQGETVANDAQEEDSGGLNHQESSLMEKYGAEIEAVWTAGKRDPQVNFTRYIRDLIQHEQAK